MKQLGIKTIKGKIIIRTGLHIGTSNDKVEIGGMDNPVIRNPLTQEPYIPGSSIKGKMRSLMELKLGKFDMSSPDERKNGGPCSCRRSDCQICRVFGCGPTRLIVRDAVLTKEWSDSFIQGKSNIIEEKMENAINRVTGVANPRPVERVAPKVEFDFEMTYRVFDTGDYGKMDNEYFNSVVKPSLKLLQDDYIGGGGSRGNGQIEFVDLKVIDENGKETAITL